jgi:3-isopropylmalate dehydrogenase
MPRLAVIKGDGIGPEVTDQALHVLEAVEQAYGPGIEVEILPFGAEQYLATGETMPREEMQRLGEEFDAILVGALGDPRVPGNEHAKDILLGMRFELDLYVNERPARLFADRLTPLKGKTTRDIDLMVFRENTEGLYVSIGGGFKTGTPDEMTVAEEINTRRGVERIIRHAFEWAQSNGKGRVTMADKSNAIPAHGLWRRVFESVGREYPAIERDTRYIDALAFELVRNPENFQVLVMGNLFGDIISDLASGLVGGLGLAPSANRHPGRVSMFEPVHGAEVTTPDLGGTKGTREVGRWVGERLRVQ